MNLITLYVNEIKEPKEVRQYTYGCMNLLASTTRCVEVTSPTGWIYQEEEGCLDKDGVTISLRNAFFGNELTPCLFTQEGVIPLHYTMKSFCQEISILFKAELVKRQVPVEEIKMQRIEKENHSAYTSLYAIREGDITSLAHNMDHYYQDYRAGYDLKEIINHMVYTEFERTEMVKTNVKQMPQLLDDVTNWKKMKDRVYLTVISASENKDLLSQVPYTQVGDLAAVYHIYLESNEEQLYSARICNNLMDCYLISIEELHETAVHNLEKAMPAKIFDAHKALYDPKIRENAGSVPPAMGKHTTLFLTNDSFENGVAALFYPDVFRRLHKACSGGFYIVASVRSELLILPRVWTSPVKARQIVSYVYRNAKPEDRLSPLLHEYDDVSGKIEVWDPGRKLTKGIATSETRKGKTR